MAAERAHASAQLNLGAMYAAGYGVTQDGKQAVHWYRLAAKQGDSKAQFNLGVMYSSGQGVLQDYVYAHMWYNIAAANGVSNASESRQKLNELMTLDQINQAQALARQCLASNYQECE